MSREFSVLLKNILKNSKWIHRHFTKDELYIYMYQKNTWKITEFDRPFQKNLMLLNLSSTFQNVTANIIYFNILLLYTWLMVNRNMYIKMWNFLFVINGVPFWIILLKSSGLFEIFIDIPDFLSHWNVINMFMQKEEC